MYTKYIQKIFLENYRICQKSGNDTNNKGWWGKGGVEGVQVLYIIMTHSVCDSPLNRNEQSFSLAGIHDITAIFEIKNSDGVQNKF